MSDKNKDPLVHLTAGAISGLASCVLLQPFDLVKTRLQQEKQLHQLNLLEPRNALLSTVKNIVSKHTFTGLWRGTVPTVFRNVPGSALYFFTLSEIRYMFAKRQQMNFEYTTKNALSNSSVSSLPTLSSGQNMIAGMVARSTVGFVMMPITVIKVRYESSFYNYKSIWNAMTSIIRNEGVKGFFYGYGVTVLRDAPQAGLYVLFYEKAKTSIGAWTSTHSYSIASPVVHSASAVFAGISSTIITQPFDMLKTRIQLKPLEYRNMWQAARKVFMEEGMLGFFDGITLRLARKTLQSAIAWTIYEGVVTEFQKRKTTLIDSEVSPT
ncbi:hypothetical protein G9A89_008024 [Geosiphon pyriformis]|nr:hypothetical protein G9A89_008024 [Geosiphon pyriformis]